MRYAAVIALCSLSSCASPPPRGLIIRAGRLLDGTGSAARPSMRIVVQDGAIVTVEPDDGDAVGDEDTRVIDWTNRTVMPGLVDAHVHVTSPGSCTPGLGAGLSSILRNLYASTAAGVTTMADLSAPLEVAVGLRRWVGTARNRGPRLLVAGPILVATGGYMTDLADGLLVEEGVVVPIDDAEQATATVRELVDAGVDIIKVGLQDVDFTNEPLPVLSRETLCALVEEAHRQERRVIAHATTNGGYRLALECGVDALAHGGLEPLDDEIVTTLAQRKIPVVPTHTVIEALQAPSSALLESPGAQRALSDEIRADLRHYREEWDKGGELLPAMGLTAGVRRADAAAAAAASRANTRRFVEAGVTLGFGTDSGVCFNPLGTPVEELRRLVEIGLNPIDALRVGSHGGARVLDLQDAIGVIAPGYRADLVAIDGQPDRRIEDVANVTGVIIDGVVQRVEPFGWTDKASLLVRLLWTRLTG